jgi:gamma-glutamyl-gamma-aminobutyrate hydrolase PuuD
VAVTHPVEVTDDRWPLRRGSVNSFHDWGVGDVGSLEVLARAADGTVEAVSHPTATQVGIMWHPEREPFDPTDLDLVAALIAAG